MSKRNGFGLIAWLIVIVLVAVIAGGGYWYWKHPSEPPPEYKTAEVALGDLIQMVTATGQLNPKTNVEVGSQVSGILSKIYVDFNSPVTNNQVIAQLDPATYKAIVAGAKADLENAKAAMELAQAEERRSKALNQAKIVAQSDYDSAAATLHQSQAQVHLKEASLQQAQVNLDYTTIYAPVDGIVISRNVDVGQTVAASLSAPTLFMIANDLSKMQIDALVSEADIGGIETNQNVNFTVDAFPTRTFQGIVVQIRNAPQTNQNVITYDTVIGVDNADLKLRPGMTANVSIITAQKTNVMKIPNGALRFHPIEGDTNGVAGTNSSAAKAAKEGKDGSHTGGSGTGHKKHDNPTKTVYVLEKSSDGKPDVAKPVQIKTGINDGIFTQVVEGLKVGDQVIISQTVTANNSGSGGSNPFGGGRRF